MPNIPLSQIPNAPQLDFGSHPQVVGSVDLSHTATLLSIPQGAFDGPAKGLQAMAKGIGDVGDATFKFEQSVQEEQDKHVLNQVKTQMEAAKTAADTEYVSVAQQNPMAYPDIQQRRLNDARNGIVGDDSGNGGMLSGVSRKGKQQIMDYMDTFQTKATGDARYAGANNLFEQNKKYKLTEIKGLQDQGQYDLASQQIEAGQGKYFDDATTLGLNMLNDRMRAMNSFKVDMENDPQGTREKLREDPASYPEIPADKRTELIDQTYTEEKKQESQILTDISDKIDDGTWTSFDQIQKAYPKKTATIARYANQIKQRLAGEIDPAQEKADYAQITQSIAALDSNDKEFSNKTYDLTRDISTKLTGEPKALANQYLSSIVNRERKPSTELTTYAYKAIDNLTNSGAFGWFDKDTPSWGNPGATQWYNEVLGKNATVKMWAASQIQQHPEWNPEDVRNAIYQHARDEHLLVVPDVTKGSLWWKKTVPGDPSSVYPSSAPAPTPAPARDAAKALRGDSSSSPTPAPSGSKVTSYAYPGDPDYDSNSANGIGSFSQSMSQDAFAVSPDVEKTLRASGIKPGDMVTLTLADGSQVTRQWQDRTMSDDERKKRGQAPLRGRWDFYSPNGKSEHDGQPVTSFQLA